MACSLASTQTAACTSGIAKVRDPIMLLQLIAELTCEVAQGSGIKIWRGFLSQTGTNAPTAVILENTLGGTITWARTSPGVYSGTLAAAFTASKTFISYTPWTVASPTGPPFNSGRAMTVERFTANALTILSFNVANPVAVTLADGVLLNDTLTILVYP